MSRPFVSIVGSKRVFHYFILILSASLIETGQSHLLIKNTDVNISIIPIDFASSGHLLVDFGSM